MQHSIDRHIRARWRRWLLVALALALLSIPVWHEPSKSTAATGAPSVYLPIVMRDAVTICFPSSGVYPVTVRDDLLGENGFVNPDGYYSDETYHNKTWKRLTFASSTNPGGGFSFVRWRAEPAGGTTISFTASLTGSGNLAAGFDEAPWPNDGSLPPKPNGYPLWPAHLSIGDWAYDFAGVANTASVRAALDYHIAKKTLWILPIHDSVIGSGNSRAYHVVRPGAFLLRGYDLSGSVYFDLVYIDAPATRACAG
jgi:hypothetical protein